MDHAMALRVRECGYRIWGPKAGNADKNGLRAKTEILQLTNPQPAPASAPKPKARGSRNRKSIAATKVQGGSCSPQRHRKLLGLGPALGAFCFAAPTEKRLGVR